MNTSISLQSGLKVRCDEQRRLARQWKRISLQNAIQRCSQTAGELLVLLESVSKDPGPVEKRSLRQKTRESIAHVKKAGKIMWKREQIIEIRDRLRADKDNVHHHISSRTGLQVVKLLYCYLDLNLETKLILSHREGQSQLDENLQVIDKKNCPCF